MSITDINDQVVLEEDLPIEQESEDIITIALEKFIAQNFGDDVPISNSWFYEVFGLEKPTQGMSYEEAGKLNLAFAARMTKFRNRLLEECSLALKTNHGAGSYSILPANKQIGWAQTRFEKDLSETFKYASNRMTFIRIENLTPAERNAAIDASATVASMKSHMNAARAAARRRKIID